MWRVAIAALLVTGPALAQRPWEQRVDVPVQVPVALPTIPPTNPFHSPVDAPPKVLETPLEKGFEGVFPVAAGVYVDAKGICQRVVVTAAALPGLTAAVSSELAETRFDPALLGGTAVPVWVTVTMDVRGRISRGAWLGLRGSLPDPAAPPQEAAANAPAFERRDWQLPATPTDALDKLPLPRRFKVRTGSLAFAKAVSLLLEVASDGRCSRVVFLDCPEGLRGWLLASAAGWTFRPALRGGAPVPAWLLLEGELSVETSSLGADALRIVGRSPLPADP